jgi:hypothetical protein
MSLYIDIKLTRIHINMIYLLNHLAKKNNQVHFIWKSQASEKRLLKEFIINHYKKIL